MQPPVDLVAVEVSNVVLELVEVFLCFDTLSLLCVCACICLALVALLLLVFFQRYRVFFFSSSIDLGQEDPPKNPATNTDTQRRLQSINRQQLHETICRLAKPKTIPMPSSQSSHQLRSSTPPVSNTLTRKVCSIQRFVSLSHLSFDVSVESNVTTIFITCETTGFYSSQIFSFSNVDITIIFVDATSK